MAETVWKIAMYGGLRVCRPDGSLVVFRTRKSSAILAVLTLQKGRAMKRSELAEILWPNLDPSKRLTNLRQGIIHLREALDGDPLVVATRESIRVDFDRVECPDLALMDDDLVPHGVLLPEMCEPWFESLRRVRGPIDFDASISSWELETNASKGLLGALEWTAEFRPRSTLEIVRSAPELAQGAEPRRLITLLDISMAAISSSDPLFGWGLCQKGVAGGMMGRTEQAIRQLRTAKEHGFAHTDRELIVESSFYLAGFQIVSGCCQDAIGSLREARSFCERTAQSSIRLSHGMGLALVHSGSIRQGLSELRQACELCDDRTAPFERAYLYANLAWFESTCGDARNAARLLDNLKSMGAARAWRIELTALLAQSMVAFTAGDSDLTRQLAERILTICNHYRSVAFAVYANEIMALDAFRANDRAEASRRLQASITDRQSTGCRYTIWDQYRLRSVAHLLK